MALGRQRREDDKVRMSLTTPGAQKPKNYGANTRRCTFHILALVALGFRVFLWVLKGLELRAAWGAVGDMCYPSESCFLYF